MSTATFSPCRRYRYDLLRVIGAGKTRLNVIMLNPSTADEVSNDPTVRRCIGFAERWGFATLIVTNIFALRSTDPGELRRSRDPIGPLNDRKICKWAMTADRVVVAWGNHGRLLNRGRDILAMLASYDVHPYCLHTTKDGQPGHPLYLPNDTQAVPFKELEPLYAHS